MKLGKGVITGTAGALCLAAFSTQAAENGKINNRPFERLEWENTQEGVSFASLQGNRFREAYMAMVKLSAGLVSPAHKKSATIYGLVLSGALTNVAPGADPSLGVKLPAGSYYEIPAGLAHISASVSKTDCVTFLYQDGKFDFLPVSQ